MPPTRRRKSYRSGEWTVPYHRFLGPGTDLEYKKYLPPLNELDWAAKRHDFNYGKGKSKEADEQFYKDSAGTGVLGAISRTALREKYYLGLDDYFDPPPKRIKLDPTVIHSGQTTIEVDQDASTQAESGSGAWGGSIHGGDLPESTGNKVRRVVLKRSFKNQVKTTDMNGTSALFRVYDTNPTEGIHGAARFAWAQPIAKDYIVPYFLTTWVTPPKGEVVMSNATAYRVVSQGFQIPKITCGEWLTKNNEEVFVPNPEPYFDIYVDTGSYIGYGNLEGITKVPNKGFTEIQPMVGSEAELLNYIYNYMAPIELINAIPNTGNFSDSVSKTTVKMIDLHDWREMSSVKNLRQGDSFTHVWRNNSLLRRPLTNLSMQGNYTIQAGMISTPVLMNNLINSGQNTAWDCGLAVATAPTYGTVLRKVEDNVRQGARKRQREERQEDLVQTEVADLNFDHQRGRKKNESEGTKIGAVMYTQTSVCLTMADRTVINKVLYTNEDSPEMVLIHVPPILRPNSTAGILYFNFEITYMLELEIVCDALIHPQKVPVTNNKQTHSATSHDYSYEFSTVVPPNRHLHGQPAKGMLHNHGTHIM